MTEPTELLPCPFCGAAAHFEMDEGRWEWVECESCGMQGNRSASLMEDCKPKLAEEWNRRTPAPVGVEPYGWHYWNIAGISVFHLERSNRLAADIDASRKHPEAHHVVPLYTTPQPTKAQVVNQGDRPFIVRLAEDFAEKCVTAGFVTTKAASYGRLMDEALSTNVQAGAVPLTDAQIKELIEDGVFLGNCKEIVRAIERRHGIKGGQHGD